MTRGIVVLLALCLVSAAAYFTASKWAIRHQTLTFFDTVRNRPVAVDIAVRRDKELQAEAGLTELPVAILNHGNTVRFTEYSFLANLFAARGYMAVSIQHDLDSDAPLVTKVGELYVGRLPVYERGVTNIDFAVKQLEKLQPNADYEHLTMVGHSNGGDISMYYAKLHPDRIRKVVTLDNLRVPFMIDGKFRILSFRSHDPVFKADPGVVPDQAVCDKAGITVVNTGFQHTDMSDRGPEDVKESISTALDKFLDNDANRPAPIRTRSTSPGVMAQAR
jgi:alpha/beta hydrolase fold